MVLYQIGVFHANQQFNIVVAVGYSFKIGLKCFE